MSAPKSNNDLSDSQRLMHVHRKAEIDHLFDGPWITLYQSERRDKASFAIFSALVKKAVVRKVLEQRDWGIFIGYGSPGYAVENGKVRYERFSEEGIEPLVLVRDFLGLKPRVIEIVEEFRLFHSLYLDQPSGRLVRIDDTGEDEIVAEIQPRLVRVRKPALTEFMAAKQMYLALFFEFDEMLLHGPNPVPEGDREEDVCGPDRIWSRYMTSVTGQWLSRLMGKRLVAPPRRPKSDQLWSKPREFESFIIGYDDDGEPQLHKSSPAQLANYFGANAGEPHYLTPVHFRREVLDKYYQNPERYSVCDGYVEHKQLWGMRIDNDHSDRVIAFLGDLGRDLPHKEQLHWKSYNIPADTPMSEVAFRRDFLNQFADATSPDHVFKATYMRFNEAWMKAFRWSLFRPLCGEDAHVWERVHVPTGTGTTEFEHQVLGLAKLMIDSLNDTQLAKALDGAREGEKSLQKFERYLTVNAYPHVDRDLKLLRVLQGIRSKAAAHRKGQGYVKLAEKLKLRERGAPEVFAELLSRLSNMLADLKAHFLPC